MVGGRSWHVSVQPGWFPPIDPISLRHLPPWPDGFPHPTGRVTVYPLSPTRAIRSRTLLPIPPPLQVKHPQATRSPSGWLFFSEQRDRGQKTEDEGLRSVLCLLSSVLCSYNNGTSKTRGPCISSLKYRRRLRRRARIRGRCPPVVRRICCSRCSTFSANKFNCCANLPPPTIRVAAGSRSCRAGATITGSCRSRANKCCRTWSAPTSP